MDKTPQHFGSSSCNFSNSKGIKRKRHANLDLELSLSTGALQSDITTVIPGFPPFLNNADVFGAVQLVDEGSVPSRRKLGPLVPPLPAAQTTEHMIPFVPPYTHIDLAPVDLNLTPENLVANGLEVTPNQQQRCNARVKICKFNGCTKAARDASGRCIAHGGGRRCRRAGCKKGAGGITVFCKAHGGGRRCQHFGCTRSAQGRTNFCIRHGGGRRCSHEGCNSASRGKSSLCIRHGGGNKCKMDNCSTNSADRNTGLCIAHGGGRRCQYPACKRGAQGSTKLCKAHGGGKRCTFKDCGKGAEGSALFCKRHGGGKRCLFEGGCDTRARGGSLQLCVKHGGGKRCAVPECSTGARGHTNLCAKHGGGKRCKSEGCPHGAQGRTDFCKAHGGGKRCSWGQLGSQFGGQGGVPNCDKFATGKSGLCAAHGTLVKDCVDGVTEAGNSNICTSINFMDYEHQSIPVLVPSHLSLPEGRVHGGNLMAMLKGNTISGPGRNE